MKRDNEVLILILLLVIMYISPSLVARFVNNILGKLISLGFIIYLTDKHTVLGLLLAVIVIAALQTGTEGMSTMEAVNKAIKGDTEEKKPTKTTENNTKKNSTQDAKKKKKKTGSEGFTKLSPAPITSGRELISLDEMLRPTDSNVLPINKSIGSPPSDNLLAGQLDIMSPITLNGTMNRGYLPAIF